MFLKQQEFGRFIEVEGIQDAQRTGRFEITLEPSGKVLHSKKKGRGFVNTKAEQKRLVAKIEKELE